MTRRPRAPGTGLARRDRPGHRGPARGAAGGLRRGRGPGVLGGRVPAAAAWPSSTSRPGPATCPAALLARWERSLEDVQPLAVRRHPDPRRPGRRARPHRPGRAGAVRCTSGSAALTDWGEACVADPADDLAWVALSEDERAVDTVLESYAMGRREQPDRHLLDRARLAAELALVRWLNVGGGRGRRRSRRRRRAGDPGLAQRVGRPRRSATDGVRRRAGEGSWCCGSRRTTCSPVGGRTGGYDADALARSVAALDADLVALQEIDHAPAAVRCTRPARPTWCLPSAPAASAGPASSCRRWSAHPGWCGPGSRPARPTRRTGSAAYGIALVTRLPVPRVALAAAESFWGRLPMLVPTPRGPDGARAGAR